MRSLAEIAAELEALAAELRGPVETPAPIIKVGDAAALKTELASAAPGTILELQPGALYLGDFKGSSNDVTLRSAAPLPDRRLTPGDISLLPTIASGSGAPALTLSGIAGWRLQGINVESTPTGEGEMIALQDAEDVLLDRVLIVAGANGQKRAIRGNGKGIALTRSHIANIFRQGQDSQAFAAWDGAGPYALIDNYLEAASENVMFGGADSQAPERIPADILVEGNHFSKPLSWKGQGKVIKNLFELKAAKRVTIRGNLFENIWSGEGQTGYAVVLTPRNQDGNAPWSCIEDVNFERNIVRGARNGVNIAGSDDLRPSGTTRRIRIAHNLFLLEDTFVLAGGEIDTLTIDHNTVVGNKWRLMLLTRGDLWEAGVKRQAQFAVAGLTFTNNLTPHGEYGVFGDGIGIGTLALTQLAPGYTFTHNVIAGTSRTYPGVQWKPTLEEYAAGFDTNYALLATSPYRNAGLDGENLGAF